MPKKDLSLGRALIKAHKKRRNIVSKDGYRHTSDLPDGRDFARLNLRSVTEQTSVNDFLDTVALAVDEYTSELGDVKIVEPDVTNGIFSEEEKALIASAQEENKEILCIPRRPSWDSNTSKEELDKKERGAFLLWRRKLSS
ncbi:large subunit GTPase 1 homolog [Stegodyphus dumicola]|uniref:large subunit GTPase 1 homolog n=1 Tax=Stegodyphus dumicola TaxID=202533 RepID=UPI0015ADFB82|nr:large subunit GTPase 1 homolog [Stegodyphus dumicola]